MSHRSISQPTDHGGRYTFRHTGTTNSPHGQQPAKALSLCVCVCGRGLFVITMPCFFNQCFGKHVPAAPTVVTLLQGSAVVIGPDALFAGSVDG